MAVPQKNRDNFIRSPTTKLSLFFGKPRGMYMSQSSTIQCVYPSYRTGIDKACSYDILVGKRSIILGYMYITMFQYWIG